MRKNWEKSGKNLNAGYGIDNNKLQKGESKMCTCIELKNKDFYFGRNLDLEYRFGEKVVITPRDYGFKLRSEPDFRTRYAMIGMAAVAGDYPLYAEAANEKGLCIAGLYFPGNASYNRPKEGRINIAPFELIPWLLGNYGSVDEAEDDLSRINLTDISFSQEMPLTDLHWMISDRNRCLVLEQTKDGTEIYDNGFGVLTNNPPFPFHEANMSHFLNLTAANPPLRDGVRPQGQGFGAVGLPGDWSPASRFAKAYFCKANSVCGEDPVSSVTQFFHILDAVAMVRGSVVTSEGKCDITTYSCCIDTTRGAYYYKTYENSAVTCVRLSEENMNRAALTLFELDEKQRIIFYS